MTEGWWNTPTAITFWTLGTATLGAIATIILTKRIEKEGWTEIPVSAILGSVAAASALNIVLASVITGK